MRASLLTEVMKMAETTWVLVENGEGYQKEMPLKQAEAVVRHNNERWAKTIEISKAAGLDTTLEEKQFMRIVKVLPFYQTESQEKLLMDQEKTQLSDDWGLLRMTREDVMGEVQYDPLYLAKMCYPKDLFPETYRMLEEMPEEMAKRNYRPVTPEEEAKEQERKERIANLLWKK